ncbi:hypothetical protein [Stackebrandtia albiflava]|nr:hypothetical protein [Stackebrandtia albiflava]
MRRHLLSWGLTAALLVLGTVACGGEPVSESESTTSAGAQEPSPSVDQRLLGDGFGAEEWETQCDALKGALANSFDSVEVELDETEDGDPLCTVSGRDDSAQLRASIDLTHYVLEPEEIEDIQDVMNAEGDPASECEVIPFWVDEATEMQLDGRPYCGRTAVAEEAWSFSSAYFTTRATTVQVTAVIEPDDNSRAGEYEADAERLRDVALRELWSHLGE